MEDVLQFITPLISAGATCVIGYIFNKLKKIADRREVEEAALTLRTAKAGGFLLQ